MEIDRIYSKTGQYNCQYQMSVEVDFETLEQCIAEGYCGYNERWHLAWVQCDLAVKMIYIAKLALKNVNDIFDLT